MNQETRLTNEQINDIALKITNIIADDTGAHINDMYSVLQHAFAIFLTEASYDKEHMLLGVEMFKQVCLHYYDQFGETND